MGTLIKILGTSGSGKSTLARYAMNLFKECEPQYDEGRRKPIGYVCGQFPRTMYVLGHYEIANGGVDTLKSPDYAYSKAFAEMANHGWVLMEGLTMRDRVSHILDRVNETRKTVKKPRVMVLHVNTSTDVCIERIRKRVGPSGKPHNIALKSVENMAKRCLTMFNAFCESGNVYCHSGSVESLQQTLASVLEKR